ncbi:c2h2 transcription protein [Diplodia corticola]|uniref:C2h2 transcription protein n=1 Tax=Diplodia corticola TaxID=236234 RepID=A0A1J9RZG8_9PEZI|nr:c2h2 transcription protein [Diplodia corticola]OJD33743.1 c2h2 transcription protein [Diplodia corticola]
MASTPLSARRYSTESTQSQPNLIGIPSPPHSDRHQCSQCPSSFLRLEHLKRHERDHWDSKPYTCHLCGKGFTRSDTLKRHEHVHAAVSSDGENGSSVSTRSHRGRHFRACHNCAQARARCSGEDVCSRCLSKALECEYPKKRRRSLQSSPTGSRNQFAAQDPAWSIGELTLNTNTNSPQHVMMDNDALSCYSSSSDTYPMAGYGLSAHDLPNLSPLEINYEQLDNGGLISPDIDTFDMGQPFPPHPPPAMGMTMHPVADVTQPINWLPTAFSEEIDYAALSGVGVPLKSPGARIDHHFQDGGGGAPRVPTPAMDFAQHPHSPSPTGRRGSQSPARSTGGSSNSSAENNTNHGRYYATSFDGARIPFVRGTKRRRSFNVSNSTEQPARSSLFRDQSAVYQFPEICVPIDSLPPVPVTGPAMDLKAYDRIADAFRQVCHGLGTTFVPFKTLAVPGPAHLNYFLQLYYEHFHPILPILHLPTLKLNEDEWVLGLAAAAIGCRYSDSEELLGFIRPMTEFLRRVVVMSVEHHPPRQMPLGVLQALLLNSINLQYSGSSRFADSALNDFSRLVEAVRTWKLLPRSETPPQSWSEWVRAEARIRLGYSIWMLDCTLAYQMDQKPFLSLEDLHAALPCNEALWAAPHEEGWAQLRRDTERTASLEDIFSGARPLTYFSSAAGNPPISEAVHTLFVRKEVKPDVGEFSRVLLLHGIYHEMWTVARYQRRSLASWVPSAADDASTDCYYRTAPEYQERAPNAAADRSAYMPENALYSKWRNAACDCLDVLHWAANATVAQHSGSEHNTICHLHLSRVILLTPLSEIVSLAKSITSTTPSNGNNSNSTNNDAYNNRQSLPQLTKLEAKLSLWVSKDQHKARLAVLHAGAVFWHVRRFSKAAFYEPGAVFLSTLALWAYATYTSLSHAGFGALTDSRSGSDSPSPGTIFTASDDMAAATTSFSDDLDEQPTFIRLDRPNDDEMVQLFVRNGDPSRMKAHVSGVGNLLAPSGPERVLREGCRILSRMTLTWGVASEHVRVLASLIEAGSGGGGGGGGSQGSAGSVVASVPSVRGPPS